MEYLRDPHAFLKKVQFTCILIFDPTKLLTREQLSANKLNLSKQRS